MIYGTCNFISFEAACKYYSDYGFSKEDVNDKVKNGEIIIGRPVTDNCDKVLFNRAEGRYFIEVIAKSN